MHTLAKPTHSVKSGASDGPPADPRAGDGGPRTYEDIVALADARGVRRQQMLALASTNDPYNAGMPCRRSWAEWFARLYHDNHIPAGAHLRRVHYILISGAEPPRMPADSSGTAGLPYGNTEECWRKLNAASRDARHLGLVDPDSFEDHRNPDPTLLASETRSEQQPGYEVEPPPEWTAPAVRLLEGDLGAYGMPQLPTVTVRGYEYEPGDQPFHLELWVEKTTMNDVLETVCRELGVNLVPGAGFQSVTGAVKLLQRLSRLPEGKPCRIFYVSDFDPAGERMPAAVARVVEFYLAHYAPGCDVKLTPVALTKEQVVEYRLPRIPIKEEDSRRRGFQDRHGKGAVELDALEAIHPGELARIIRGALAPYRDGSLPERLAEAGEEAREVAQAAWDEATAPYRHGLQRTLAKIRRIVDAHRGQVERLDDRMQAALAPLRAKAARARHAISSAIVTADLPDRPGPEAAEVREDDWLYASDRGYEEQLRHYPPQAPKKKIRPKRPEVRIRCAVCGTEFVQKSKRARYCSGRCRVAAHRGGAPKGDGDNSGLEGTP
jgi:hypothetical protein